MLHWWMMMMMMMMISEGLHSVSVLQHA